MKLDHIIAVVVVLGTLAFIIHRVTKKRKEIRRTIAVLGPGERPFCDQLMRQKVKKLRLARA